MLTDWIHWLSSVPPDQLLWLLGPVLLLDTPRYALSAVAMALWDCARSVLGFGRRPACELRFENCPSVCVILAGLNEADTIEATLQSLWGTYPQLEIIVVDDGSKDEMTTLARRFAREHDHILVLRKPRRGGKSSALNFALPFTDSEVLVCLDADSHLDAAAIWEIVQPFADPHVGAVSGTVLARNGGTNLVTWLQAYEYLRCIFLGRAIAARVGTLGIVSGAFGAFRRSAIERVKGWDVGPGEDGDLVLRLRKAGYRIASAPYAKCFTNLPTSWWQLIRQRRRWEWAVVTFESRKHIDLVNPLSPNFRLDNLLMVFDRWLFNLVLVYAFFVYAVWIALTCRHDLWFPLLTDYAVYVALESLQLLVLLFYSRRPWQTFRLGLILPLSPLYCVLLKLVALFAITEEILFRRSFRDDFVPSHVREATWHW